MKGSTAQRAHFAKHFAPVAAKAAEYLQAGTPLVWVVDPEARQMLVHRPGQPTLTLSAHDTLEGGDVLPGFTLPLTQLFAELN